MELDHAHQRTAYEYQALHQLCSLDWCQVLRAAPSTSICFLRYGNRLVERCAIILDPNLIIITDLEILTGDIRGEGSPR